MQTLEGQKIRTALAAALLCVGLAGTASAGTIRDDRGRQAYLDLAADPRYASVGRLDVTTWEPGTVGSGTLVASDWVLTAAHVLEGATSMEFNIGGQPYTAARWLTYPKYNGDLRRGFDLGLVQLTTPVPGVTPASIYHGRWELGATATFVGFGKTGDGVTGATIDDRLKRAGTNVIDGYVRNGKHGGAEYKQSLPKKARTFVVDFDNPGNPADNIVGSAIPTDLEYLIAPGDSGGPVFVDEGYGPLLAGIHSFGEVPDGIDDSDYGDVTGHTRVSSFDDWIGSVIGGGSKARKLHFVDPSTAVADEFGTLGFGMALRPEAAVGPTTIPEPSGLLALAGAGMLLTRRRRSQR